MATKKAAQKGLEMPKGAPDYHLENITITNTNAPTNENTREAVVALARALEANANALAETARALKGGDVKMENGILIGPERLTSAPWPEN